MSDPDIRQMVVMDRRLYGLAADSTVHAYNPDAGSWEPFRHDFTPAALPPGLPGEEPTASK
jgi:hypothetical protein